MNKIFVSFGKSWPWAVLLLGLLLSGPTWAETAPCITCSVQQKRIHSEECPLSTVRQNVTYYFCERACQKLFLKSPETWIKEYSLLEKKQAKSAKSVIGETLPDFRFPLKPVGSLSRDELSGKVVIFNLWANWCQPCLKEMPHLVELQREFQDRDFLVIGLSFDKSQKEHREGVDRLGLNFVSVFAEQPSVKSFLKELGPIKAIPVSFVVDGNGKIVERIDGAADLETFRKKIEPLLKSGKRTSLRQQSGSIVPS